MRFMFGDRAREQATADLDAVLTRHERVAEKAEREIDAVLRSDEPDKLRKLVHRMRGAHFRQMIRRSGGIPE